MKLLHWIAPKSETCELHVAFVWQYATYEVRVCSQDAGREHLLLYRDRFSAILKSLRTLDIPSNVIDEITETLTRGNKFTARDLKIPDAVLHKVAR